MLWPVVPYLKDFITIDRDAVESTSCPTVAMELVKEVARYARQVSMADNNDDEEDGPRPTKAAREALLKSSEKLGLAVQGMLLVRPQGGMDHRPSCLSTKAEVRHF